MAATNNTTIEGMMGGLPGVRQFGLNTNQPVDFSGAPSVALPGGTTIAGANNITSTSATALTVARAGTNYGLQVDESTSSAATGLKITPAAAGSGVILSAISSGTDEALYLQGKGAGGIFLNASLNQNIHMGYDTLVVYPAGGGSVVASNLTSFQVGPNGTTNPVLLIDTSVASQATGLKIQGKAAGSGVILTALSSGSNEAIYIRASGTTGAVHINDVVGDNIYLDGHVKILDTMNIVISGTTGTKIGDVASAKIGFYGATPIVQPVASTDATSFVAGSGTASKSDSTWTGASGSSAYTVGGIVTRLKALGLLAA